MYCNVTPAPVYWARFPALVLLWPALTLLRNGGYPIGLTSGVLFVITWSGSGQILGFCIVSWRSHQNTCMYFNIEKYWVMTSKQPKIVIEKGQRESRVFEKHNCDIKESTMQNKKPTKPNVYATQMPLWYQHRDKRLVTFKFSRHTADDPVASEVPARKLKIDSHGVWCWQSDGCWLTGLY